METVLTLLVIAGVATAAWHLVRAALRFLQQAAAGIWAGEMARTYARRGDLTALEAQERERSEAMRSGARSGLVALAWLAALAAPALIPWAREVYAVYALLLLEPVARRARRDRGARR
ncbi:MAG: hypothetical protein R6U63_03990 [Longimicrobiales bacterium]